MRFLRIKQAYVISSVYQKLIKASLSTPVTCRKIFHEFDGVKNLDLICYYNDKRFCPNMEYTNLKAGNTVVRR